REQQREDNDADESPNPLLERWAVRNAIDAIHRTAKRREEGRADPEESRERRQPEGRTAITQARQGLDALTGQTLGHDPEDQVHRVAVALLTSEHKTDRRDEGEDGWHDREQRVVGDRSCEIVGPGAAKPRSHPSIRLADQREP